MEEQSNSKKQIVTVLAVLIIMVVIVGGIGLAASKKSDDDSVSSGASTAQNTVADTTSTSSDTSSSASSSSTSYKDGSYSASGDYFTPGGDNSIDVQLTVSGGVIKSVSATTNPADRESEQYDGDFLSAFKQYVVGKSLDDVSLSRVSGASLTTNGFNKAMQKIADQAKA